MTGRNTRIARSRRTRSVRRGRRSSRAEAAGQDAIICRFPGHGLSSARATISVFMRGDTPLTSRLLTPVLIDAGDGTFTDGANALVRTTLLVSQPLHFGDYGGMPFKIIWAILDVSRSSSSSAASTFGSSADAALPWACARRRECSPPNEMTCGQPEACAPAQKQRGTWRIFPVPDVMGLLSAPRPRRRAGRRRHLGLVPGRPSGSRSSSSSTTRLGRQRGRRKA